MSGETVTLKKIYKKLGELEQELTEVRFALLPIERIPKKELKELEKTSKEMRAGNYLTVKEAISALEA